MGLWVKNGLRVLLPYFCAEHVFFLLSSFFSIVLSKLKLKFQKDLTHPHQKQSIGTKGYESNLQKQHHVPLLSLLSSSPITLLESPSSSSQSSFPRVAELIEFGVEFGLPIVFLRFSSNLPCGFTERSFAAAFVFFFFEIGSNALLYHLHVLIHDCS
jgi:hypothetical protein